nr:26s proteasome non-atpase regulatory subunit 10 [Quercus suber]
MNEVDDDHTSDFLESTELFNRRTTYQRLENGVDVDAQVDYYGNALYAASARGNFEMVRLLLDSSADTDAQGGEYTSTLCIASDEGHAETVKLLLEQVIANGASQP